VKSLKLVISPVITMENSETARAPTFWRQIMVLQTKNMKTLSRNRRRIAMLILYPIYFVALLSLLKQSAKAQSAGFWGTQPQYDINKLSSVGVNESVAYSCDSTVTTTAADCDSTMNLFQERTGFKVVPVANVVDYWQLHQDYVIAGVELKAVEFGASSYVIRLDNEDLKSAIEYGSYGIYPVS
jgi:hypothetical protein